MDVEKIKNQIQNKKTRNKLYLSKNKNSKPAPNLSASFIPIRSAVLRSLSASLWRELLTKLYIILWIMLIFQSHTNVEVISTSFMSHTGIRERSRIIHQDRIQRILYLSSGFSCGLTASLTGTTTKVNL